LGASSTIVLEEHSRSKKSDLRKRRNWLFSVRYSLQVNDGGV
jgi:hypothetical protein